METSTNDLASSVKGTPEDEGAKGNSSKNKKPNNKKYFKARDDKKTGKPTNDPAYYSKYPELLEASANLNYSDPYGKTFYWDKYTTASGSPSSDANTIAGAIPGVLAVCTKPSFGYNDNQLSPVNVAANALYVNLRYKVSGRKNYDPVDLMMYMGAISELYSFVNFAARAYAMAFTASQTNFYIMDGIARATGLDLSDIRKNLANFRFWLNSFIERVSAYAIPAGITYFDKKVDQYTYIYIENNDKNIKDQLYINYPHGFFRFDLDDSGSGMLKYRPIGYGILTVNDIINIGEDLMQTVWGDEDFGLISGDIIKAYEGKIVGLSKIESDVQLTPVYDEMYLLQLKNATLVGPSLDNTSMVGFSFTYTGTDGTQRSTAFGNVVQNDKGLLLSQNCVTYNDDPRNQANATYAHTAKLISQIAPNPGLGDNIEATRMMVRVQKILGSNSGNDLTCYAIETGAYIIADTRIAQYRGAPGDRRPSVSLFNGPTVNVQDLTSWTKNLHWFMFLSFRFAPMLFQTNWNGPTYSPSQAYTYPMCNIDNYTFVDSDTLAKMHDCAWLSMFHVDGVAIVKNTLV